MGDPGEGRPWVAPMLAATFAVAATIGMGRFGMSLLLPGMRATFGFSTTAAGVLAAGSLLGFLLGAVGFASRAATIGEARLLALGATTAAVGFGLTASAPNYPIALAGLVLGGIGTGVATVAGTALALATAPPGRRGLVLGIVNGGTGMGVIAIGVLAPRFDGAGEWRTLWWIVAGAALGSAVAALTIRAAPAAAGLAAAVVSGRSADVWGLYLVYFGFGFAFACYATYFGSFLIEQQDLSHALAGGAWRLLGFVSLVSGVAWGRLSDRWGRGTALALLMAIQGLGFVLLLPGSSMAAFVSAVVVGATAFAVPGLVAAAAADLVGPARASALYGFSIIFSSVGQASGPPLVGALSDAMGSYRPAFVVAAVVAAATATASTTVLRPRVRLA